MNCNTRLKYPKLVQVNLCYFTRNIKYEYKKKYPKLIVRTIFGLNPKQNWVLAQQAQTMNL